MVLNNKSTSKPHLPPTPPPSSSSSSAQFQFPLQLPPLMTGTTPNPNPYPHQPPIPNPNFPQFPITPPTFPHDPPQTRDFYPPNLHTQTPLVPHWVDQQTPFNPFATDFGVPDYDYDYDYDIDRIVAQFLNNPITEVPDGPSNGGDDESGKGFLKRGTVDYLRIGLPIDDNALPKRTKTTTTTTTTGELYDRNLDLSFDFPSLSVSPEEEQRDRRGKRKLDDHGADSGGNGERVVIDVDDENGDGDGLRKFSREEKMKGPMIEFDFWSGAFREAAFRAPKPDNDDDNVAHRPQEVGSRRRERFRDIAKENASRFALFTPDAKDKDDDGSPSPETQVEPPINEGPTPFSTAMTLIKEKGMKNVEAKSWVPNRNQQDMGARVSVPSLKELCLKILANNADALVSLDGVPDDLRHRLSLLLCDSRKMNSHFFELLVRGSPTEIRLTDCSWLSEDQLTKSFETCDTTDLEVLQLDQCGRCIPDYILEQSPRWLRLTRLTTLSLSGACRLSDKGLRVLVSSAPALRSINLSQCSLLTSASINILANSLKSLLKELYLDDCQNIDAAHIVPALKEFKHLEVLSLAGIQTVCDKFIKDYIIARGHNLKELVLKDCIKLTDASMKIIADYCPGLCVLDLMNLCKLTDLSVGYLANRCLALHTLKLCRGPFSDEAIAAFIKITGESLKELSLNNIKKVGHNTTLSLASHAKNLHTLDLSWCRNLTDNELGLIVDSCFSLRLLKLFGCTQVTDVFLNGYSNPEIQIIGLKMSPLLQHVKVPDPHQGALRYSPVSVNLI